ncbi:MAG: hypothetical protein ACTH8J_05730 [Specibacter sp.]
MDGMGELLFGRVDGGLGVAVVALRIAGVLLMCAALVLLGRRHELGWWLAAGAFLMPGLANIAQFPATIISSPMALALYAIGIAVPLVLTIGVAFYGLLSFQKLPLSAPMTRAVTPQPFRFTDIVAPLVVALACAAASMIAVISLYLNFSGPLTLSRLPLGALMVSGFFYGLLPAGLLGLAHRSRWAWFLVVAGSAFAILGTAASAQGSVLIFLYLAQGALAIYGWGRWAGLPAGNGQAKAPAARQP